MKIKILRESELLKIKDPEEFFKRANETLEFQLNEASKLFAENKLVVKEEGQWTLKLGTELTFDEAFGPASPAELAANKKKPLSEILAQQDVAVPPHLAL